MDLTDNDFQFFNVVNQSSWDWYNINRLLCDRVNQPSVNLGQINLHRDNTWVWTLRSQHTKITPSIYFFHNSKHMGHYHWKGWKNLWKLKVMPRAKFFTLTLLHSRIKTLEFLKDLNIIQDSRCVVCAIHNEIIDHLFRTCNKSQIVWARIENLTSLRFKFGNSIATSQWLEELNLVKTIWKASLIVTAI